MKKLILALALILVPSMALTGCGQQSGSAEAKDKTLITSVAGDPINFHPDLKADDNAYGMNQNIFNRLVKLGPKNNVIPDLAKSWEFSEDGLTLTFHLHDNVKWHDGTKFTAADVVWTFETMRKEKWRASSSLSSITSITAPDDNTVVMKLSHPDSSILGMISWYGTFIMPKHLYEGTDQSSNEYNNKPVGTGPFKFSSWEKGVSVKLTRNDDYFKTPAKVKELVYMIIPDQTTAYQSFINGEIDVLGGAPPNAEAGSLDNNPDYNVYTELWANRTYLTFNFNDPHFKKKEVRQAVALGIDRDSVFKRAAKGQGARADYFISPLYEEYIDKDVKLPEYNKEAAIKLLEDAGYKKDANGFYFSTTLDGFEDGNFKDIATIVQANLKEIGIDVKINMMENAAWSDKVLKNKNFQMTMLAGYQGPDVSGVAGRIKSDGATNMMSYNNPKVDELLTKGVQVSDKEERIKIYKEVQKIMSEDMPLVLLVDNGSKTPVKKYITGLPVQNPDELSSNEFTLVDINK